MAKYLQGYYKNIDMEFSKNFKDGGVHHCGENALTQGEQDLVLSKCESVYEKILIKMAIVTVARRDDLVNIEWKNVDLKNRSIIFYEKKKKRMHTVYFGEKIQTELIQFKSMLPVNSRYLFIKYNWSKDGMKYVKDKHINSKTAYNIYNKVRERAGLPPVGIHSLRSTGAKRMLENGWDLIEVAAALGDTLETVQRHYLAVSPGQMQDLAVKKEIL